jgi:hypothetical protein
MTRPICFYFARPLLWNELHLIVIDPDENGIRETE